MGSKLNDVSYISESDRGLKLALKILLVMNLGDAIFTSVWVINGLAIESNPFMATLLESNPGLFIITKIFLVTLCIFLLWRLRSNKMSKILIIPIFILYAYINFVHIFALFKFVFFGFGTC